MASIFQENIEKLKQIEEKMNVIENKDVQKIYLDICARYPAAILYGEGVRRICERCTVSVYGLDEEALYGWSLPIYGDLFPFEFEREGE